MTEQNTNESTEQKKESEKKDLDFNECSKNIAELVSKIQSGKLSKQEFKQAKKSLDDMQKLLSESIKVFENILPSLTASEKRIVDAQKFGIADSVINQIFDKSEDVLNKNEQEQFINLLTKVLKSTSKREQNKVFKGSDDLKEALYLHNDNARREKLNREKQKKQDD